MSAFFFTEFPLNNKKEGLQPLKIYLPFTGRTYKLSHTGSACLLLYPLRYRKPKNLICQKNFSKKPTTMLCAQRLPVPKKNAFFYDFFPESAFLEAPGPSPVVDHQSRRNGAKWAAYSADRPIGSIVDSHFIATGRFAAYKFRSGFRSDRPPSRSEHQGISGGNPPQSVGVAPKVAPRKTPFFRDFSLIRCGGASGHLRQIRYPTIFVFWIVREGRYFSIGFIPRSNSPVVARGVFGNRRKPPRVFSCS